MSERSPAGEVAVREIGLPIALSLAGHAAVIAMLILFAAATAPPLEPLRKSGVEVLLSPFPALAPAAVTPVKPTAPPTVAPTLPEQTVPPLPAVTATPAPVPQVPVLPPEHTLTAETPPPPPRKPAVKPKPRAVVRQQTPLPPVPQRAAPAAPPAVAALPYSSGPPARPAPAASVPGPDTALNYRALISAWFESHKRYPESARERGEEGKVTLRFRVARSGRVINYALLESTGYADLDRGVEEMMNGAQLPPFPPGMTSPQIEVSVRIGFSLTH